MANDLGQHVRKALVSLLDDSVPEKAKGGGPLSGMKGVAAGAAIAGAAPLVGKGAASLAKRKVGPGLEKLGSPKEAAEKAGSKMGDKVSETVGDKVDKAGGAQGLARQVGAGVFGGSDDDGGGGGGGGTGSGRRMPVQQAIDVGVPLQTAYNQWTQFEEWPRFMHRLEQVDQKDDCTISFSTKIWGINKTFEAEIIEQYPDERIKWEVASGPSHTGVVTFHQLTDTLTRIELNVDFDPDSLLEKAGRGWRFVKRAVRADLHRFKAFLEMNDEETGAWRGTIEDGEVIEPHEDALEGAGEEEEQEQPQQQREQQRGQDEGQEQEVQDDQGQDEGGQRRRPPRHGRRRPDGSEHDQDQEQALRPPRPPRAPALG